MFLYNPELYFKSIIAYLLRDYFWNDMLLYLRAFIYLKYSSLRCQTLKNEQSLKCKHLSGF